MVDFHVVSENGPTFIVFIIVYVVYIHGYLNDSPIVCNGGPTSTRRPGFAPNFDPLLSWKHVFHVCHDIYLSGLSHISVSFFRLGYSVSQCVFNRIEYCCKGEIVRMDHIPRAVHGEHDVITTLNQRQWRWFNVAITWCAHWEISCPATVTWLTVEGFAWGWLWADGTSLFDATY